MGVFEVGLTGRLFRATSRPLRETVLEILKPFWGDGPHGRELRHKRGMPKVSRELFLSQQISNSRVAILPHVSTCKDGSCLSEVPGQALLSRKWPYRDPKGLDVTGLTCVVHQTTASLRPNPMLLSLLKAVCVIIRLWQDLCDSLGLMG